jgi:DNA-3-methyladenine glycosylase
VAIAPEGSWDPAFWHGDVLDVARGLLGARLRAGDVTVRLTEVEAYRGEHDPASHAFRGQTKRNAVMFGPPGHAYVYFIFGMYWCLNVVCGDEGEAAGVLLRAGEVIDGEPVARERRGGAVPVRELARGPGRLTIVLGIDGIHGGLDLLDPASAVTLSPPERPVDPSAISAGPRVGVAAAHDLPWRFWLTGDPTVSQYRRHTPRRRPSTSDTSGSHLAP